MRLPMSYPWRGRSSRRASTSISMLPFFISELKVVMASLPIYSETNYSTAISAGVALRREPPSRGLVALGGHVVDTGRVDPDVVEVEEGAHRDRVVEGLVGPPRRPRDV